MKSKIKVGSRVEYNGRKHANCPHCYPPAGTLGTVIKDRIEVDGSIEVEWDAGTGDDRKWWTDHRDVEVVKPYGKFENADALLSAYESLEKEFTRKCQALKDMRDELSRSDLANNTQNAWLAGLRHDLADMKDQNEQYRMANTLMKTEIISLTNKLDRAERLYQIEKERGDNLYNELMKCIEDYEKLVKDRGGKS